MQQRQAGKRLSVQILCFLRTLPKAEVPRIGVTSRHRWMVTHLRKVGEGSDMRAETREFPTVISSKPKQTGAVCRCDFLSAIHHYLTFILKDSGNCRENEGRAQR